jgi:RNA polymerase sigma-70 factor (ECF subfamily)
MTEADDERLLAGLSRGDEWAFAAVYDRFGAALFRVARALLGSHQTAEDCVQDVFVGLVRARHSLPAVRNLRAYLFTALRHGVARQADRARRLRARTLDEQAELPQPAAASPHDAAVLDAAVLERALKRLPAEQREVVVLKISGGLTFAEIAATLDIRPNTAASRYRYALEKLRQTLQEDRHV